MEEQVLELIKANREGVTAEQLRRALKQPMGRIQLSVQSLLAKKAIKYGSYGRYVEFN